MLYKEDLDKMECAGGHAAAGLWVHAKCHFPINPGARYEAGILTFYCTVCNKMVAQIAVATAKK